MTTVGMFDGIHLGHRAVLSEVATRAAATGRRGVLVTFDPHPLRILRPADAPRLLTTPREKQEILEGTGLEVAVLRFTEELAGYDPERFVDEVLLESIGTEELVIGDDHGVGRGRAGDVQMLEQLGEERGFSVAVVEPVDSGSERISSSRVRAALHEARLAEAAACLGRPYSLRGVVVRGDGRGRGIGFPTANLAVQGADKLVPPEGIYGHVRDRAFAGALHLGPRPTFEGAPPSVELHLIDFDEDIYGVDLRVDFLEYLRGVEPFESVEALVAQIEQDVDDARRIAG